MKDDEKPMKLPGDNPIREREDDTLGRASVASSFAQQVLALDASEGVVVGVLGAWGAGKTSFINLAREDLTDDGATVLDFNPWMFSGADQLIESFFVELAAQLKIRRGMAEIAADFLDYGEAFSGFAWLPLVGPWIDRGRGAAKVLAKMLKRRKEGVGQRREKLNAALGKLANPVVVVLDDIDRLSTSEIRDIFKLVRLTASFPNIIYLLAFDRARVETALADEGVPGRDYLEKILQLGVDLPAVPHAALSQQIFGALDDGLSDIPNPGPLDAQVWPDLFAEVVRPLIRNMRDVRRYAVSVHGTIKALDGQVALADVLALEAIRVFMPDTFGLLHRSVEALTTTSGISYGQHSDPPELKDAIDVLIGSAGNHEPAVRALIERVFPAALRHLGGSHYGTDWKGRWLRERRVAHEEIFRLYLERVVGAGLQAFVYAEQAWEVMADPESFDEYLRSLHPDQLEDVISSLESYEDEFRPEHVVPGSVVLLNLHELPDRPRGLFDFDSRLVIGRVVYRLLRSLGIPENVTEAARQILPQLSKLSAKLEVVTDLGYREGAGHKLVSEEDAVEFEKVWRDEVRSASVAELVDDPDLLRVLLVAKRYAEEASEPPVEVADSPDLTLALIRAARSEVRSQYAGSRAVRRSLRLAWDALVEVFNDEDVLRERFERLKDSDLAVEADLSDEVEKYLSGWRPDDD